MAREKVFRFKQFSVRNDKSAMKVGTDGVLLGSWADTIGAGSVLDIGTGTGLIALMIAQRCDAHITAVEIDEDAASEALHNFSASLWKERLHLQMMDFKEFATCCVERFDLIVSNPPYFIDSLKCPDEKRDIARHTGSLSYGDLLNGAVRLLTENGCICLITPFDVESVIENLVIELQLQTKHKTLVYPTPESSAKRILWNLSKENAICKVDSLIIEKERHIYTDEYIALTRDYYLKF